MARSALHRYVLSIAAGVAVLTSATRGTDITTTTPITTTTTPTTTYDFTTTTTTTPTTTTDGDEAVTTFTASTSKATTPKMKVTAEGVLEEVSEMLKKLREVTRSMREAKEEHDRLAEAVAEVTKAVKDMGEHNQHIKKKVRKMSKGMKKNSQNKKIKDGIKSLQRDHQRILHAMSLSGINITRLHNHTKKHNQTKNNHNHKNKRKNHSNDNHTTTTTPANLDGTEDMDVALKEALTKKDEDKDQDDTVLGSTDNLINELVVDPPSPTDPPLPEDCREVMQRGNWTSGVYMVQPQGLQPIKVWCDHTTNGGGWTVLLARLEQDNQQDFSKGWAEYKKGIGDPAAEHWLGLDALHMMTKARNNELRVNITDWNNSSTWAEWKEFRVAPESDKYKLTIGRYTSDSHAGDALKWHNGMKFSTPDMDNDVLLGGHCAKKNDGGWWYRGHRGCYHAHPTGRYQHNPGEPPKTSVTSRNFELGPVLVWQNWRGESYYPKSLFLMFRPSLN